MAVTRRWSMSGGLALLVALGGCGEEGGGGAPDAGGQDSAITEVATTDSGDVGARDVGDEGASDVSDGASADASPVDVPVTTDSGLPADLPRTETGTDAGVDVPRADVVSDLGMADTGRADTGRADTGTLEVGLLDTGTPATDTGTPATDTGRPDTGTADTGTVADTGRADTGAADTGAADTGAVVDTGSCSGSGPSVTFTAPTRDEVIETCTEGGLPVYYTFSAGVTSGAPLRSVVFNWRNPDGALAPPTPPALTAGPYSLRRLVGGPAVDGVQPLAIFGLRGAWQFEVTATDTCGRTVTASEPFTLTFTTRRCPNP